MFSYLLISTKDTDTGEAACLPHMPQCLNCFRFLFYSLYIFTVISSSVCFYRWSSRFIPRHLLNKGYNVTFELQLLTWIWLVCLDGLMTQCATPIITLLVSGSLAQWLEHWSRKPGVVCRTSPGPCFCLSSLIQQTGHRFVRSSGCSYVSKYIWTRH